jgi:tetratricopeptide (TPR) repeat protein
LVGAVVVPASLERWSTLERVAAAARRHDLRAHALQEIAARVTPESRAEVLRRLARAHMEAADSASAESAWQEVWALDPDDDEADQTIEQLAVARGDYAVLADHLGRRAERLVAKGGSREALRAIRLRRAVILEQRLGRLDDAAEELSTLLGESPDNEHALSYLADLYERMGRGDRAAPLWRRVATITRDPARAVEIELRAAQAAHAAGDHFAAIEHLRSAAARQPLGHEALQLGVEIARSMGDDARLGDALEELAMSDPDSATRSDRLVEAAQAAARAQDVPTAIARAQRAAKISPTRASAQLYARGLEYRVRGAGSPDEARHTIEELARVEGQLGVDDAALQAFLLAEAFDVLQGGGAGFHRLVAAERQLGEHALLSLGLAERYVAQWKFPEAVPHFRRALEGNVFGLRKRGRIALAAADAALRVEDHESALRFLDVATGEADARPVALRRLAQIVTSRGDVARSRAVLLELARMGEGDDRARTLAQLARVLVASGAQTDRREALRIFEEAIDAAAPEGKVRAQLRNELDSIRLRPSLVPRGGGPGGTPSSPPGWDDPSPAPPLVVSRLDVAALERAASRATTPGERTRAQIAMARAHLERGEHPAAEGLLREALRDGSGEAGDLLAQLLERDPSRSTERLLVRRRLVDLSPGHAGRLESLRAAALADRDTVYARAIEHVLRAFDPGAGPLPPPPLVGQGEHASMLGILLRPSTDANVEPFAHAWESAHVLFAKTPIAYVLTGVERVVPGNTSAIARLYEAVIRVLGLPRSPLFHKRAAAPATASVTITHPASAVVAGDVNEDTVDLRYALGHAVASALPQHVLALSLPEPEARNVWAALLGAFGPPDVAKGLDKELAKLAESFWQTVPTRAQRKLQELLGHAAASDFDAVLAAARQSVRRVAMFVAGDFGYAARVVLRERKVDPEDAVGDGLRVLCAEHAPLADLVRLAVSPEYADARWQTAAVPTPSLRPRAM